VGADAKIISNVVRLDSDSFFGLLVATSTVTPGVTALHRLDDLHVYAGMEGGKLRFYFAVRHEGV